MSSRKLVSVQEITNIEPIEGADRIEVARILGWRVVVGKDMGLKPGDRVAYFETDSLLPAYDPRYKSFQARGQKTMIVGSKEVTGHVLRTVKLRGVYSQGLIMRLDELGFRYTPLPAPTSPWKRTCSNTRSPCRWAACRPAGSTPPAPSRMRHACRRSPTTGRN